MESQFKGRREDLRLVTGRGRFASDWNFPDQAYAVFLRADRAHAELKSVDVSAARRSPGVLAVLTGEDTKKAGFGAVPARINYTGRGGAELINPHREVLAETRVRFLGQEVALVVAESERAALDAIEKISVEYNDLPVVVDAEDALSEGAVELYPGVAPNNLCFDYEYGDARAVEEAFSRAARVVRLSAEAQRLIGSPMEPKAGLAVYDANADVYDIHIPTQGATAMRASLAGGAKIPEQKIRIHALDVGGGFGVRSAGYSEYCALMLAAKTVGRPVKWVATRSETMASDHHGRAVKMTGELALDHDGRFLGLRVQWIVNCGAYLSGPGPRVNTMPPAGHSANIYKIPAVHGLHRLALTNTTPTTAYRGAARPNVSYLIERLVDEAARAMNMDRVAIRRLNFIHKEDFPYRAAPLGHVYDSGDPDGLLDEALKQSDSAGFDNRRKRSAASGKLRGMGLAAFVEPSGGGGSEDVAIVFDKSGNPVLYAVSGPSGQGHETAFPEIVSRILGVPAEQITYRPSDPDGPSLKGGGTVGSRSTMSHGVGLHLAAIETVEKGKKLASDHLEAAAADIEFSEGRYRVRGTDVSIGLVELARLCAGPEGNELDTFTSATTSGAFPSGVHVAEVELDPETGVVEVCSYVAVDDSGTVINHVLVEGQLHGGIMQGLGQVLGEQCVYDKASGQLVTGSYMDYEMPRADAMDQLDLFDRGVPSPNNPLGVKGVGEAGTTGAVPTLANAIIDALRPLGINHLETPFTPQKLWHAMAQAREAKSGGR